ncbi:hypothetical protein ACFX13_027330 [Malus domestica]
MVLVRGRNFRAGCSLADEHTAPRDGWSQLRLPVGLLLYWRACRAKLFGQGLSGKALRARLKENDRVNFERVPLWGLRCRS